MQTGQQAIIGGDFQILTINKEWHVATIERKSTHGSWKTIWHYDTVSGKEHAFSENVQADEAVIKLTEIQDLFLYS